MPNSQDYTLILAIMMNIFYFFYLLEEVDSHKGKQLCCLFFFAKIMVKKYRCETESQS